MIAKLLSEGRADTIQLSFGEKKSAHNTAGTHIMLMFYKTIRRHVQDARCRCYCARYPSCFQF